MGGVREVRAGLGLEVELSEALSGGGVVNKKWGLGGGEIRIGGLPTKQPERGADDFGSGDLCFYSVPQAPSVPLIGGRSAVGGLLSCFLSLSFRVCASVDERCEICGCGRGSKYSGMNESVAS